jgi:serine/threonine protein kinase
VPSSLKPANIFLDSFSNVKLGDYGLAVKKPAPLRRQIEEAAIGDDAAEESRQARPGLYAGPVSNLSADDTNGTGEDLTRGVGTALYSAPEQGKGVLGG